MEIHSPIIRQVELVWTFFRVLFRLMVRAARVCADSILAAVTYVGTYSHYSHALTYSYYSYPQKATFHRGGKYPTVTKVA